MKEETDKNSCLQKEESNRIVCNICGQNGKLVHCNKCSALYHVQCHYPTVDPKDISNGKHICSVCEKKTERDDEKKENKEIKEEISALELLAVAASVIKSREHESSNKLPGMSSESDRIVDDSSNVTDSNSAVSLPARSCSQCGRTCRKVPLIACDYCPSYFHQDCLDPPLTVFPIGKWMCPKHPDRLIKQNQTVSCHVTERMKLWDEYVNQPLDQCSIKLDFTRKMRIVNPSFRTKLLTKGRPRVKVPSSIKFYYKNPVRLSPTNCSQSNSTWPVNTAASKSNQPLDFEEICNVEKNRVVTKEEEKTNAIKKEREEYDNSTNEEENEQNFSDAQWYDKVDSKNVLSGCTRCTTFESHMRCSYNIRENVKLLERPVLEAFAIQRLKQILNPESYKMNCHRGAKAVLFSLNPKPNSPSFITRGNFVIGNAPDCDLVLSDYSTCGFTSSKHAIIFFDEMSGCFELLNYSEHGTVVDNVLYSCDYIPEQTKEEESERGACVTKEDETSEIIKMMLHKENVVYLQDHACKSNKIFCKCSAKSNDERLQEGWEGSAVLAHGSIVTFGCITFAFNILNTCVDAQSPMS